MRNAIQEKADGYFAQGHNCCQSVMLAANDIWDLNISTDLIYAGQFFLEGMSSGCTCGALVGIEMSLGIIQKRKNLNLKPAVAEQVHDHFVKTFGSSCCRVLRKKQGFLERTTKKGCKKITSEAAGILYDLMEELEPGPVRIKIPEIRSNCQ